MQSLSTIHPENRTDAVVGYIDRSRIIHRHPQRQRLPDAREEANAFRERLYGFGHSTQLHAVIDRHDVDGFRAYGEAGYDLHITNGDRPQTLAHLVQHAAEQPSPDHLVVVSDDLAFMPLCTKAADAGARVSFWSTINQPPAPFLHNGFEVQPVNTFFPLHRVATSRAVAWLDLENLVYGFPPTKRLPDPAYYWQPIQTALTEVGSIAATYAYGDFFKLRQALQCDVRPMLEKLGVKTYHQDNIRGKNSADMAIASAIHTTLAVDPNITTIIIGSGDRDFCPLINDLHKLKDPKRVILIAQPDALSQQMESCADRVIHITHKSTAKAKCTKGQKGCHRRRLTHSL